MECVGTGTLKLTLTAGTATPVSTTMDCATTGNAHVTAVLQSTGDVVSNLVASAKANGTLVWKLSRT